MRTELCDRFGIDVPIFAFSHCRDVVAAVSKAGGMGVLGALAFSPEQLEIELQLDRRARRRQALRRRHRDAREVRRQGARARQAGRVRARSTPRSSSKLIRPQVTASGSRRCSRSTRCRRCPRESSGRGLAACSAGRTAAGAARSRWRCSHPAKLLVNALGPPPKDVIDLAHEHGVRGGRAGRHGRARAAPEGAGRRHHRRAGHRGGRAHRRDRLDGADPRRGRRRRADAGARRRRHRERPPGGGRARARRAGRLDRLGLARPSPRPTSARS